MTGRSTGCSWRSCASSAGRCGKMWRTKIPTGTGSHRLGPSPPLPLPMMSHRLALIPGQLTETLGPGDKVGGLDFGPVWEPAGSVTNGGTLVTAVTTVVILGKEMLTLTKAHITKDMLMELVITLHHGKLTHFITRIFNFNRLCLVGRLSKRTILQKSL